MKLTAENRARVARSWQTKSKASITVNNRTFARLEPIKTYSISTQKSIFSSESDDRLSPAPVPLSLRFSPRQTLTLTQYQEAFIAAAVDGAFLYDLNDDDLKSSLGVEHRLHRKKILNSIHRLKAAEAERVGSVSLNTVNVPPQRLAISCRSLSRHFLDEKGCVRSVSSNLTKLERRAYAGACAS